MPPLFAPCRLAASRPRQPALVRSAWNGTVARTCSQDHVGSLCTDRGMHACGWPTNGADHGRGNRHRTGDCPGAGARRLPRGHCRPPRRKAARGRGRLEGQPPILTHTVDVADRESVAELFRWADKSWAASTSWSTAPASTRPSGRWPTCRPKPGMKSWRSTPRAPTTACRRAAADARAQRRPDHQYQLDLRPSREHAGRSGLFGLEIRPDGAEHGRGTGRRQERHPRDQHLPGRGRHAAIAPPARGRFARATWPAFCSPATSPTRADGRLPAAASARPRPDHQADVSGFLLTAGAMSLRTSLARPAKGRYSTVQVSPLLNRACRSPLPRFCAAAICSLSTLFVARRVDGAEHADRLGKLGMRHPAEQVGQRRLGRLFVVEQQVVFARCPCPVRPPRASCR